MNELSGNVPGPMSLPVVRATAPQRPMLRLALDVLRRRWLTFAVVAGTILLAAIVVILLLTPKYMATTKVKIDPIPNAASTDTTVSPVPDQNVVDTEVNVMQSRDIALTVAKQLHLANDAEFTDGMTPAPDPRSASPAVVNDWYNQLADKVLSHVDVEREKQTYVIDINVKSVNPARAAQIANAIAQAYMNFSVGARTGTASKMADFLGQRLNTLGQDLSSEDARVAELKARAGIIEGGSVGSADAQQLGPLSVQLATAESDAAAAQSNLAAARSQIASGGLENVSGVLGSQVVADLRRQRAEVLREKDDVESRYGPRHPATLKVQQQLATLDSQIQEEGKRVVNGMASAAASASARAASLRAQVNSLRGSQEDTTRAAVEADALGKQVDAKRETYSRLSQALQQSVSQARNTMTQAEIVQAATAPEEPASPNRPLLLIAGLALGLVAGAIVVTLQELFTPGLRTAAELESQLNVPLIASIPRLTGKQLTVDGRKLEPADLVIARPITPFSEALRVTRSTLLFSDRGANLKIVSLVSALPGEGKTSTVLSLARVMAMAGERVLLIDCDLRRAGLSKIASPDVRIGLVEVLHDETSLESAVCPDQVPGLDLLPVSAATMSAEDMFGDERMRLLLERVSRNYDRVLMDTPPLLGVADARTLATLSQATLLLVKWNSTPAAAVENAVAWLEQDNAPLIGAVFTMVNPKSEAIGAMYYSRQYSKYYQQV